MDETRRPAPDGRDRRDRLRRGRDTSRAIARTRWNTLSYFWGVGRLRIGLRLYRSGGDADQMVSRQTGHDYRTGGGWLWRWRSRHCAGRTASYPVGGTSPHVLHTRLRFSYRDRRFGVLHLKYSGRVSATRMDNCRGAYY